MPYKYQTNGASIYLQSFATIRAEADLTRFGRDEEQVVVRMIHAAGMVGLEKHCHFSNDFVSKAREALENGAPILCDARMVSEGITRPRLPAKNEVIYKKKMQKGEVDIDNDNGLKQMKYTIDSIDTIYNRHKLINVRF